MKRGSVCSASCGPLPGISVLNDVMNDAIAAALTRGSMAARYAAAVPPPEQPKVPMRAASTSARCVR